MFFFHSAIYNHKMSLSKLQKLSISISRRFFNTSAQFTNAHSIHSAFYHCIMIDDNQKRFIPHLTIETELFHSAFENPCMMVCAPFCAFGHWVHNGQLLYEMAALALKGSHEMGDGRNFLKSRRAFLFNDDLSNEPNLDRIHLAGQYL